LIAGLKPLAAAGINHTSAFRTVVKLPLRRRGIGTSMWEVTSRAGRDKGFEKIFTYIRADNEPSLNFHLKLGFRIIGKTERQIRMGGIYVDGILIERFL
jgi:L-amino acid N-acyltransferase YncA